MLRGFGGLLVIALGGLICLTASAQEASVSRQFGAGVHDFYQGRYFEAIRRFDVALAQDARDPRVYFFRGLAKQRLGWTGDAENDFRMGSQLEAALKRRDVGLTLQRIQGPDRLLIERYRTEARQLPEAVVRNVIPQPVAAPVQRSIVSSSPRATRAQYVPRELPADSTDPFGEQAQGLLGRGELKPSTQGSVADAPVPPAASALGGDAPSAGFADEAPFGSGVANEADGTDADPFAFAEDPSPTAAAQTDEPSRGVFGAVLGAFSRTLAPAAEMAAEGGRLLQGAQSGGANSPAPLVKLPPQTASDPATDEDDPFAFEPSDDDAAEPAANGATEPNDDDAAPPANDAADPFADEDPIDF